MFYYHPMSTTTKPTRITDALTDKLDNQAKPLVAVLNGCHAVTFIGEDGDDYVFKNSYGENNTKNPAWIKIPKRRAPFDRIDLNFRFKFPFNIRYKNPIRIKSRMQRIILI